MPEFLDYIHKIERSVGHAKSGLFGLFSWYNYQRSE